MQHLSQHAKGSLVCLMGSGLLFGISLVVASPVPGFGWLMVVGVVCLPAALFSLLVGATLGALGIFAEGDWQFRLQAGFSGLLCGGCPCWLWFCYFLK